MIERGTEEVREALEMAATRALLEARRRTLALVAPLPDEALRAQHSPLMSPPVWDLAHVANYEERWLVRALGGPALVSPKLDALYDPFRQPRRVRGGLPLLSPADSLRYLGEVRRIALELKALPPRREHARLRRDAFVYGLVAQHEHQHDETVLATLQLMERWPFRPAEEEPAPPRGRIADELVYVEGGPFTMGTSAEPWAYDNERPAHEVELAPFLIDAAPVSNGAYLEFIEAGGYDEPRWWSRAGWEHREREGLVAPLFWRRDGRRWLRRRFARVEEVPPDEPVQHVCWYEAEAYARFRGKRLPTEAEWEKAASWSPSERKRRYPWGDAPDEAPANLSQRRYRPTPVGSFPEGRSAYGCFQLLGEVWEWTASDFLPYPGFESFPYREYSEVFFGPQYKILRGGSWATHLAVIRNTFRNWDFPVRRQIFAGFRCARDAR